LIKKPSKRGGADDSLSSPFDLVYGRRVELQNRHEREAKNRKHPAKDKIKGSSQKKEFIDQDGNLFSVTPQGLFYCPKASGAKKHSCPDCYFCQWCSDSRCSLCRRVSDSGPAEKGPFD
jgi:hypothetical protein